MDSLKSDHIRDNVLDALSRLELLQVKQEKQKPFAVLVGGAGVGMGCIVICRMVHVMWILSAVAGIAGLAMTCLIFGNQAKTKNKKQEEVRNVYFSQFEHVQEIITTLLEET